MTHSVARPYQVTCGTCGLSFNQDVWEIVDGEERPDLYAQVIDNTLHEATCPQGHTTHVRAPLLLYLPSGQQPLFFSESADTQEGFRKQETDLIAELRSRVGSAVDTSGWDMAVWLPLDTMWLTAPDEDGYVPKFLSPQDPEFGALHKELLAPLVEGAAAVARVHPAVVEVMAEIAKVADATGEKPGSPEGFNRAVMLRPDLGERLLAAERLAEEEGWADPYDGPPPGWKP